MKKVHVTQCLCPARHCITAIVWEEPEFTKETAEDHLKGLVEGLVAHHLLNPWCGICNSRDLRYEDGITRFKSMHEALPELAKLQLEQIRTMQAIAVSRN